MDRSRGAPHPAAVLRILITRALLLALPLILWGLTREIARRWGRELPATPWGWLVGAGAVLVGLSLMVSVAFRPDNRGEGYVPAQAHPGGVVTPGGFDPARRPPPASEVSPNTSP